jgi:hypothetical protein
LQGAYLWAMHKDDNQMRIRSGLSAPKPHLVATKAAPKHPVLVLVMRDTGVDFNSTNTKTVGETWQFGRTLLAWPYSPEAVIQCATVTAALDPVRTLLQARNTDHYQ